MTMNNPNADPIHEFNSRGGIDPEDYKKHVEYMENSFPDLGKEQWEEIKSQLPEIETMEDPETGQKLRFQRHNWPASKEDLEG